MAARQEGDMRNKTPKTLQEQRQEANGGWSKLSANRKQDYALVQIDDGGDNN